MNAAWWALAVSALSLVAATSSLAWNIYVFQKGGPVVIIKFGMAFNNAVLEQPPKPFVYGDLKVGAEWTLLYCDIYNKGRSAIDVTNVTFGTSEKTSSLFSWTPPELRELLPARLESNSSIRFSVTAGDLINFRPPMEGLDLNAIIGFTSTVSLGDGTVRASDISFAEFANFALDPVQNDIRYLHQEARRRARRISKRK